MRKLKYSSPYAGIRSDPDKKTDGEKQKQVSKLKTEQPPAR